MKNFTLINKKLFLLISFIGITFFGFGQTQIYSLDFETAGGYATSIVECTDNAGDYFIRTDNSDISATFINTQGSYFFAAQDIDAVTCPAATGANATLLIDDVNISGYTNLELRVYLAEDDDGANQDWDGPDYVHFNYDIGNTGTFSDLLWIEGSGTNTAPQIDTDFNGVGDGAEITETFIQFTQNIAGTGNLIDIEIVFDLDAGDEDIAIDNIEIWGTALTPNQILITQYYEGDIGFNKWCEIKNISGSALLANTYYIARYNNLLADAPSGVAPNFVEAIPAMAVDEIIVYKHPSATIPADPVTGTLIISNVTDVNGDDLIVISTTNDATCYDSRVDIIGDGSTWGSDTSFVRGCGADTPNTTFTLIEWTQFELADVNTPIAADANVALGVHNSGGTIFDATFSWTNGTPDLSRSVVIDEIYDTVTYGSLEACSLIVNAGGRMEISNSTYLEVENDITVDGQLWVATQGSLVQRNDLATYTDNTVNQSLVRKTTTQLTNWYDYTYWSSPVANETVGTALAFSNPTRRFWFDANNFLDVQQEVGNTGTFIPGNDGIDDNGDAWQLANAGDLMTPGVGFAASHNNIGFVSGNSYSYTFYGVMNNGVITTPIYYNGANGDLDWNFIGNPYPSAIDSNLFFTSNAGVIDGVAYLWSHNTMANANASGNEGSNFAQADYALITNSGVNTAGGDMVIPADYIPSCQGFFVQGLANLDVTFNNSMRMADTSSNDQFFRMSNTSNRNVIWINLTSDNGVFNQMAVSYLEGATNGNDGMGYDATRNLSSGNVAIIYTSIEGSPRKYAIQGKDPNSLNVNEIIPLGMKNTIEVDTQFKFSIAQLEGEFMNENTIYLKDNLLDVYHNLSNSDYTFTSEVGEFNDRFELRFASTLSIDEFALQTDDLIIVDNENIGIDISTSRQSQITNIKIFDLLGRELQDLDVNNKTLVRLNTLSMSASVYIAKVTLLNGQILTKKIMK